MNIVVLGAGAIGSVYGVKLSARHDVTLVGTAAHVRAIEQHGLRVEGAILAGTFPLKAGTSLERIEPGTLVILTTKVSSTVDAVSPIVRRHRLSRQRRADHHHQATGGPVPPWKRAPATNVAATLRDCLAALQKTLPLIERGATDERNFVKKGVSWALRGIGHRNARLRTSAMTLAQRLAASGDATARWVGRDTLRDLKR